MPRDWSHIKPGTPFGSLTVMRRDESKTPHLQYICRCVCGREVSRKATKLKRGEVSSCGCQQGVHDGVKGEANHISILNDDAVLKARRLYKSGLTCPEIIEYLNLKISRISIWRAVTGKTWTHLRPDGVED